MTTDRKVTVMFWLLLAQMLLQTLEKTHDGYEWFQRRFGDRGNSLRYAK